MEMRQTTDELEKERRDNIIEDVQKKLKTVAKQIEVFFRTDLENQLNMNKNQVQGLDKHNNSTDDKTDKKSANIAGKNKGNNLDTSSSFNKTYLTDVNVSRVENMYLKISGKRGSQNLNSSMINGISTYNFGQFIEQEHEKVNIGQMKMYDWILRKIGSKKHYSYYIKVSTDQIKLNIDEEKPLLLEGMGKLNLRISEVAKIFEEKSTQKTIVEDLVLSASKHLDSKNYFSINIFNYFYRHFFEECGQQIRRVQYN